MVGWVGRAGGHFQVTTRRTVLCFLASLGLFVTREARADLIAEGERRVDYTFSIENASKFPDYVFLAHPYTTSFGAPKDELGVIDVLPMIVGKYVTPVVHAMKRSDFDASGVKDFRPEALEAFFTQDKTVLRSTVRISPVHTLPAALRVRSVHDVVRVEKLEAGVFVARLAQVVYQLDDGQNVTLAYTAEGNRPDPPGAAPTEPAPGTPDGPPATRAPSGCGGCGVTGEGGAAGVVLGLGILAALRGRRRMQSERPGE